MATSELNVISQNLWTCKQHRKPSHTNLNKTASLARKMGEVQG